MIGVFFLPISVSNFHFQFPFPVSVSFLFPAFPYAPGVKRQAQLIVSKNYFWLSRRLTSRNVRLIYGEMAQSVGEMAQSVSEMEQSVGEMEQSVGEMAQSVGEMRVSPVPRLNESRRRRDDILRFC